MKRLLFFSAMVLSCVFSFAQDKTSFAGIYYYNSSSYGVMYRDSADYYRVVENNNTFNDYYAKDNTLRASGTATYIDADDDNNSRFDGAFIAYYPNGKVWIKQFFKDGVNDGEYTEYFENGLMKQHEFYKNGVLDGVKTLFEEDGKTCKQWEYKDGQLVNDYYTQSGGGYSVDYDSKTKEPKWRDVSTSDLNVIKDKKGNTIQAYAINGLYVSLDVAYRHYFGRYYVLQLYIQNNSPEDAYFTFDDVSIDSPQGKIRFFSKSDFERRMNSRQGWAQFGLSAASFATAVTLEAITDEAFYRQIGRAHV